LLEKLYEPREKQNKIVISLYGGFCVGKSGITNMDAYYLNVNNIKNYAMSGDNYPRRIPKYNDEKRPLIFRKAGLKKLITEGLYSNERFQVIQKLQEKNDDANPIYINDYSF
jgi:alpha-galactosidase